VDRASDWTAGQPRKARRQGATQLRTDPLLANGLRTAKDRLGAEARWAAKHALMGKRGSMAKHLPAPRDPSLALRALIAEPLMAMHVSMGKGVSMAGPPLRQRHRRTTTAPLPARLPNRRQEPAPSPEAVVVLRETPFACHFHFFLMFFILVCALDWRRPRTSGGAPLPGYPAR
jgi:hypothetical protein